MITIVGHPIRFGSLSQDLGGFVEEVGPNAVDRALREHADVVMLIAHDHAKPVARVGARSLILTKDATGLEANAAADEQITYVGDAVRAIRRGDAVGASFGFVALADAWQIVEGVAHRTLLDIDLHEVSVAVVWPAYRQTRISVRNERQAMKVLRDRQAIDARLKLVT